MGLFKKTALMVIGALALLFALGAADNNKYLLMPSYTEKAPALGVMPRGRADEAGMHRAISQFNHVLSLAYLSLNSAPLKSYPMDEELRRSYIEELAFLQKGGRALELTVKDVRIDEVERLSAVMFRVKTAESVAVRYLTAIDRKEIASYPSTRYVMNYVLKKSPARWTVVQAEAIKVEKRDE